MIILLKFVITWKPFKVMKSIDVKNSFKISCKRLMLYTYTGIQGDLESSLVSTLVRCDFLNIPKKSPEDFRRSCRSWYRSFSSNSSYLLNFRIFCGKCGGSTIVHEWHSDLNCFEHLLEIQPNNFEGIHDTKPHPFDLVIWVD